MQHARHAAPKMTRQKWSRKRKWLFGIAAIPLFLGGAAFAYFNLNTASSHVDVANAPSFMISIAQPTGTPLAPGVGSETVLFSVVNQQGFSQTLHSATYAVTSDAAGGIYDTNSNAYVDSCLAAWFDITGDAGTPLPLMLQPGGAMYTGSITVTMPADPTDDQNSCAGLAPQVTVTLS